MGFIVQDYNAIVFSDSFPQLRGRIERFRFGNSRPYEVVSLRFSSSTLTVVVEPVDVR